ncbi:uncharacterized protein LOC141903590 [Tubulanus polymorphus]|uniref:uncharacterized protein LOC141903590 n=1 Tax=Tubulanus polymorphus TaxID=672921 RepID=UPI003DA2FA4C
MALTSRTLTLHSGVNIASRQPDVLVSYSTAINTERMFSEVSTAGTTSAAETLKSSLGGITVASESGTAQRIRSDTERSESSVASISSDSDGIVRVFVTEDMQGPSAANPTGGAVNMTQPRSGTSGTDDPATSHENHLRVETSNLNPGRYIPRNGESTSSSQQQQHLPDILNSHLPPAYESLSCARSARQSRRDRGAGISIRMPEGRFVRRNRRRRSSTVVDENAAQCKCNSCLACITTMTYFKWVLVLLSVLGLCCIVTGIILGALHMTGSSYLSLSLMFIGLGVMLVIVVIVAWRCTPAGHEPCHLLFGLGSYSMSSHQPSSSSSSSSRHRSRQDTNIPQWHGGMLYPECAHRQPPPSYTVSMQQYERQLQARLENNAIPADSLPSSPPPTYRSRAGTMRPGLHITFPQLTGDYPNSRPPTYRSHISNTGTLHRPSVIVQTNEAVCGGHGPISLQPTVTVDTSLFVQTTGTESDVSRRAASQPNRGGLSRQQNQPESSSSSQAIDTPNSTVASVHTIPASSGEQYFGTAERDAVECFDSVLAESWRDINGERPLLTDEENAARSGRNDEGGVDNLASDTSNEDNPTEVTVADVSIEISDAVML